VARGVVEQREAESIDEQSGYAYSPAFLITVSL
jgi:hypothetical protein